MPAVALHRKFSLGTSIWENPLPELLHTPAGLAILEIQGTIHASCAVSTSSTPAQVGRLEFPLYQSDSKNAEEGPWMKKVYLYIGKHQRLTGEIKKLAKPMVVLDKDAGEADTSHDTTAASNEEGPHLNILAIVKHKILFSNRPEPVGL